MEDLPFVENTENSFIKIPVYKSELIIGNITVRFTKKFNYFNRLMMKLVFGWDIKNYERKINGRFIKRNIRR